MGKKRLSILFTGSIAILLSITIFFSTISCSKNIAQNTGENISGSYMHLFTENEIVPDVSDLGRPLGQTVIWEHISYGLGNSKHHPALYSFDPNKSKITERKDLSSVEQENYSGIRLLEDKIMVKSRDGYYFLDGNLNSLGNKVVFSEQLINELKRLERPNGLYYNHFDISKDGQYVYYTDEQERSLFRYDLVNNEKITLLPEIEIWDNPQPPNPGLEDPKKLPYRLYDLLLTPSEQFLIAKIAGYKEAYYVFNLSQINESLLIDYLPVNITWSTIQNFIPIYNGSSDNLESMNNLNLAIMDLTNKIKRAVSIPLPKNLRSNSPQLYAAFNKDFLAFTLSNKQAGENLEETVEIFDFNSHKQECLVSASKLQLGIVALLNDGRAIINYSNMYGDKKGFFITK
ncbi:MAG: hypothetical protein GX434_03310 [Peptococcaceae bacterium]|nr:hypothetical protein [Peptococcaceae bacterium]